MAKGPSGKRASFLFIHRESNQRFDDLASEASTLMTTEKFHQPPLDIYETSDSLRIEIELPGVLAKEIELYLIKNRLYLRANKYDPEPVNIKFGCKDVNFICMERKFGWFRKEIDLPVSCNTQDARARFNNGLLVLEIPKIMDRRGRRLNIPIEVDEEKNEDMND